MPQPLLQAIPRALQVFFSYASGNHKFVSDFARFTRFRPILGCKIWNYEKSPISVGGLESELHKRLVQSDVVVAFICGNYARSQATQFEFEAAVKLIADRPAGSQLRTMVFLVLDADGAAWWRQRRRQSDIKDLWNDPVWLDCSNELGTAPADVTTADMTRKIDALAEQLQESLTQQSSDGARSAGQPGA